MGEKVMRVQARITAQQSVLPGSVSSDSSSLDYKEIFKKVKSLIKYLFCKIYSRIQTYTKDFFTIDFVLSET